MVSEFNHKHLGKGGYADGIIGLLFFKKNLMTTQFPRKQPFCQSDQIRQKCVEFPAISQFFRNVPTFKMSSTSRSSLFLSVSCPRIIFTLTTVAVWLFLCLSSENKVINNAVYTTLHAVPLEILLSIRTERHRRNLPHLIELKRRHCLVCWQKSMPNALRLRGGLGGSHDRRYSTLNCFLMNNWILPSLFFLLRFLCLHCQC